MSLTVQMIESQKDKELPGKGTFVSYKLTVTDGAAETQNVELFQRKDSIPPKVGDVIDGALEDGPYGKKIKKNAMLGGKPGGFRPRDPKETAAIQRQHSQSVAVEFLKAKVSAGSLDEFPSTDQVRLLIDWFQRDIEWGVRLASVPGYGQPQKVKEPERTGQSDVPAAQGEFVHAAQSMEGTPWET